MKRNGSCRISQIRTEQPNSNTCTYSFKWCSIKENVKQSIEHHETNEEVKITVGLGAVVRDQRYYGVPSGDQIVKNHTIKDVLVLKKVIDVVKAKGQRCSLLYFKAVIVSSCKKSDLYVRLIHVQLPTSLVKYDILGSCWLVTNLNVTPVRVKVKASWSRFCGKSLSTANVAKDRELIIVYKITWKMCEVCHINGVTFSKTNDEIYEQILPLL